MSDKSKLTPVRKEGIADTVRMETLKVLAEEGEVFQSKLIAAVSSRLALEQNTTSGLVRKFLNQQDGKLVKISRSPRTGPWEPGPRRKYWSLTFEGMNYLYMTTHDLWELSKAVTKVRPPEFGGMLAYYEAIARSKKLSEEVKLDLEKYNDRLEKTTSVTEQAGLSRNAERALRVKVDVGITFEIGQILVLSVIWNLAQDKDLRDEVGHDTVSNIYEFAAALALERERNLRSFRSMIRALRSSMESR